MSPAHWDTGVSLEKGGHETLANFDANGQGSDVQIKVFIHVTEP